MMAFARDAPSRSFQPKVLSISPDGRDLRVAWAEGGGVALKHLSVDEELDQVVVTAHMHRNARSEAVLLLRMRLCEQGVTLRAPLGDRRIVERVELTEVS